MAGRERLPYLDLRGWQGLYTKSTPEALRAEQLRTCQNADFFEEYGALSKIRGSSRILSTPWVEGGTNGNKITWIEFYKAPDLDGTILRHTLVANGTHLGRVENSQITPLLNGRTAGLFHSSDMLDRFMYISNYNPDRVGEGDEMVKYDGAVMTKWGVEAPGGEETVIDTFDDASSWTAENCTLSDQTNATVGHITWDGSAVRIDHEFYSSGHFSLEKNHNEFYAQGDQRFNEQAVRNRVSFFTYLPRGTLTASLTNPTDAGFRTNGPVISVYVSPDSDTTLNNSWQFDFSNGNLSEGWNKINLNFNAGPPGGSHSAAPVGQSFGIFYPETTVIKRTRFQFYVQTNATTVVGVRMDRYEEFDEGAPATTVSGSGSITGVYSYKVLYVSKYGQLSNVGPKSVDITAASHGQINLTRIPLSSDAQVVARRIYRTVGNGSVWLFLDEILDNVTTTYTDTTADGSLSNETPPQAGDFSDDNSIPPNCGIVKSWKKTMFLAGDPQNPYTLFYSEDNEPESFPLINSFELDSKITAMYESYAELVIETETGKWQLIGENPDYALDKIVKGMGCVGRRAAGTARLIGYSVDRDGLRLFDGSETKKISEPIRDKYDDSTIINKANVELIHTVHSKSKNCIMQFNPDSDGVYSSIFLYQYPIDQVETGYWTDIVTPDAANLNFLDATEIEDSNGDFQLLVAGADGMIYRLFDPDSKNWVDKDGTTYAIDTIIETAYMRLGALGAEVEQSTGRVNPHSLEMKAGNDDAATWTATISMAKGPSQTLPSDTATLSMAFGANNALIRQRVPSGDITPDEFLKLKFQHATKDVYTKILSARLYFHVQPAQYDVIDVDNVVS